MGAEVEREHLVAFVLQEGVLDPIVFREVEEVGWEGHFMVQGLDAILREVEDLRLCTRLAGFVGFDGDG